MRLNNCSEVVGTVTDVSLEQGCVRVVFSIESVLEFPVDKICFEKLKGYVGKRIGIFNNDGNYKVRVIKKTRGKM